MHECTAMTKRVAPIAALVSIAIPLAGAVAQTLSPALVFEGNTTTPSRNGVAQPVRISIQSWKMSGPKSVTHEIPPRGFYVAHLLSGAILTTIDGQTTKRAPGDYWTVKAGADMQVKVLGEFAVLETIVVTH
jgi:quercetin dioxygenase-like cupin family protein